MTKVVNVEEFKNINVPKVVINKNNELLYISRSAIPISKNNKFQKAYKQVCIYCYPREILLLPNKKKKKGRIETIEDIEIIRFLELGYTIKMLELKKSTLAVDTPSDLRRVRKIVKNL